MLVNDGYWNTEAVQIKVDRGSRTRGMLPNQVDWHILSDVAKIVTIPDRKDKISRRGEKEKGLRTYLLQRAGEKTALSYRGTFLQLVPGVPSSMLTTPIQNV